MNSWIVHVQSLKNKDVFRIALLDRPLKTKSYSGLDSWIVPGFSLKNKKVFRIGLVDCPRMEP